MLLAEGMTNAEIAADLSITVGTVKTHLTNVQSKLGARNRVEIAAWAWRSGLIGRGVRAVGSSRGGRCVRAGKEPRWLTGAFHGAGHENRTRALSLGISGA
ncbi:hypothetical protein SBADM41S_06172 [Streptomyces badius]